MSKEKKTIKHYYTNNYYQNMGNLETMMLLQAKVLIELNKAKTSLNLQDYEFKVSSQNGEDGIIQYLINKIQIKNKTFIEFGVENYKEANTRFLLQNDNWSGLIIDGNKEYMHEVKNSTLGWKFDIQTVAKFITKENINDIFLDAGISGEIGLLSIDIDGNDYWVWESIDCINPQIVIVEYNSMFGDSHKITVPYDKDFYRTEKHFSNLYFGASICAFEDLARKKGYSLVGSNSFGNNLFFVRSDCICDIPVLDAKDAYVKSKYKESRDENGKLSYLSHEEGIRIMKNLPVVDITDNNIYSLKEIFGRDNA